MTTLKLTPFVRTAREAPHPALHAQGLSAGWAERLAAWAARQPRHRHLGSWTAV